MISIAFCDNEVEQLNLFKDYCKRYNDEHQDCITSLFFNSGFDLLESEMSFDAAFLDIDMPLLNGMEVAEKIRLKDSNMILVFVTMLSQYAIRGYKVNALDYILKPVNYFEFSIIIDKIIQKHKNDEDKYFLLRAKGVTKKINYNDILYFEMFNHDVYVHTNSDTYNFRGTLKDIEQEIDCSRFVRCSNSFIVNLSYVEETVNDFAYLKSGEKIEITKSRRKDFLERLVLFLGK